MHAAEVMTADSMATRVEPPATLWFEEIHAGYTKRRVLQGLSLEVAAGRVVAMLGTNGAGKSTALKVAAGLRPPQRGRVWLEGSDVTAVPVHARVRRGIGYLMQGGQIFSTLTVEENLQVAARAVRPRSRAQAVQEVLELFPALAEASRRRGGLLSGGQRQWLALGMAVVASPRVLLLDEPTAGLSPSAARGLLERVLRLAEERRWAVLLVEQRVREALSVAHQAVILAHGTVTASTDEPARWLEPGALDRHYFLGNGTS